jgi:pilus assembly protein CpaC
MTNNGAKFGSRCRKLVVAAPLIFNCALSLRGAAAQTQAQAQAHATPPHMVALAAGTTASASYRFSHTAAAEQALHIVVGRSMFVDTGARLRRVYIANPTVLDSYTANPNEVVVTAKTPGTSSIILWDENGNSKSYLISSDVNVEPLQAAFRHALPTEDIKVEGSEGRVVLSGAVSTSAVGDAAVKLALLYSKDVASSLVVNPSQIKQVKLVVRIIEIDRSKATQFGVNIIGAGGSTIGAGTTSQFPVSTSLTHSGSSSTSGGYSVGGNTLTVSDPLNFLLYSSKINIGVTIKDLENKQILQILAEPTITTLSGEKANFLAGGEFPFPVVQGGSGGLNSVSVQFRPFGVKLEFTPYVNADGTIELKVAPEVSSLDYTNAAVISGYTIPALATRRAETQVVLKNGQSFAISGLLDRRTTDALGRTPGIASIPILGQLFRSKSINHSVSELVVIVTPTIVDPLTEDIVPTEPKTVIPMVNPQIFDKQFPVPAAKK